MAGGRIVQIVEEHGHDALPRRTRETVTVTTTAAGTLTVHVDLDTSVESTPAPLASTLTQRYQAPTWHLLTQRLALDLSTTALETLQTSESTVLTAMSDAAFADAVLAVVLGATPTPFPDRVRHRLEVQAQHDAVELATTLETRGPSLVELEYLLALRQSATRPARLLSLLRQEHFTVLSAAHYQAIRVALAHNTFQQVDGIPWPTAVLVTGPARGHAELRPLVADTMSWLAPEVVWSKYSCGLAMIVFEEPTEPFSTLDRRVRAGLRLHGWEQDDVAFALMRTFSVIMRHILRQNMAKRALAKQDHPRQRFRFHRLAPPLRKCIQPGRFRWQGHTLDPCIIEQLFERRAELLVPVVHQILSRLENAPFLHSQITSHLFHPLFTRMCCHPGEVNLTGIELDEKQDVKRHQPTQRIGIPKPLFSPRAAASPQPPARRPRAARRNRYGPRSPCGAR